MKVFALVLLFALVGVCLGDLSHHSESGQMHDLLSAIEARANKALSEAQAGVAARVAARTAELSSFKKDVSSTKTDYDKAVSRLATAKAAHSQGEAQDAKLLKEAKANAQNELALIAKIRVLLGQKRGPACPVVPSTFPKYSKWEFAGANGNYHVSNSVMGNTKYTHAFMVAGLKEGHDWKDYTMEADVRNVRNSGGNKNWGHPGVVVNYQNSQNYEVFYFRPHSSGSSSAVQYYVRKNGKNTFPATFKTTVPGGSFFHVKVVSTGSQLKLFLHNSNSPVAVVQSKLSKGSVGFVNHGSRGEMKNLKVCMN